MTVGANSHQVGWIVIIVISVTVMYIQLRPNLWHKTATFTYLAFVAPVSA